MENLIQDYRRSINGLGSVYERNIYNKLKSDRWIIGDLSATAD